MANNDITTIQISKQTRDHLKGLGRMGETYDDVIRRLIKIAKGLKKE